MRSVGVSDRSMGSGRGLEQSKQESIKEELVSSSDSEEEEEDDEKPKTVSSPTRMSQVTMDNISNLRDSQELDVTTLRRLVSDRSAKSSKLLNGGEDSD